jgi:hypothetical protein
MWHINDMRNANGPFVSRKFPPIPIAVRADVAVRTKVPDVGDAWIWAKVNSIRNGLFEVEDIEDKWYPNNAILYM